MGFFLLGTYKMKYIDSHCHIVYNDNKIIQATTDAKNNNIMALICNSCTETDWISVQKYGNTHPEIIPAIGIHPWYIDKIKKDWEFRMTDILNSDKKIIVGEIGLDKNGPNMDIQEDIFITQLQIAKNFNRTASVHCVGAWEKILQIFKKQKKALPPKIIAHAYNGPIQIINKTANEYNMFFSYGPNVLELKQNKQCERIYNTPVNRILVESDNAENIQLIPCIVKKIAEIKNIDTAQMADIIYKNSIQVIQNG